MFEGLSKSRANLHKRRATTFIVAIALHVVGVVAIGIIGRAAMKQVTGEDPIELVFRAPPPPPPPPPGGGGKKKEKKKVVAEATPVKTPEFQQPQEIPEETPEESTEDVAEDEGDP